MEFASGPLARTKIALSIGLVMSSLLLTGSLFQWVWTGWSLRQKVSVRRNRHLIAKRNFIKKFRAKNIDEQDAILEMNLEDLIRNLQLGVFTARAIIVDSRTNAITEFLVESLDLADELDSLPQDKRGPLHGVPISLKEHIFLAGKDATVGNARDVDVLQEKDGLLVSLLKDLGAVPFCRTNIPQTLYSHACSNPIFGTTRNYLDPQRSPGGSSGGEGALIAGGGSIIGIGSDVGGSVRIPAAYSGISSLKPTSIRMMQSGQRCGLPGLVGVYNTLGVMGQSADSIEYFCRQMWDNKEALSNRHTKFDPRFAPVPWDEERAKPGMKLTIGWYDYDNITVATPSARRAVQLAVNALAMNGHKVVSFCPPNMSRIFDVAGLFYIADGGKVLGDQLQNGPIDMDSIGVSYRLATWPRWWKKIVSCLLWFKSPHLSAAFWGQDEPTKSWQIWELNAERIELIDDVLRELDRKGIDVLLSPGMPNPAPPLGHPYQSECISYSTVYNMLDFPAGSVPVTLETKEDQEALIATYPGYERDVLYGHIKDGSVGALGMPLNVQVIAKPFREEVVLRVMREIQQHVGIVI